MGLFSDAEGIRNMYAHNMSNAAAEILDMCAPWAQERLLLGRGGGSKPYGLESPMIRAEERTREHYFSRMPSDDFDVLLEGCRYVTCRLWRDANTATLGELAEAYMLWNAQIIGLDPWVEELDFCGMDFVKHIFEAAYADHVDMRYFDCKKAKTWNEPKTFSSDDDWHIGFDIQALQPMFVVDDEED